MLGCLRADPAPLTLSGVVNLRQTGKADTGLKANEPTEWIGCRACPIASQRALWNRETDKCGQTESSGHAEPYSEPFMTYMAMTDFVHQSSTSLLTSLRFSLAMSLQPCTTTRHPFVGISACPTVSIDSRAWRALHRATICRQPVRSMGAIWA